MAVRLTPAWLLICVAFFASYGGCTTSNHTKVIIVGAGMSGIGFATTLKQKQISDFVILEAKDYVGGRVKSVLFDGKNISAGAAWIQGTGAHNSVWKFKLENNLQSTLDNFDNIVARFNGSIVDVKPIVKRLEQAVAQANKINGYLEENLFGDLSVKTVLQLAGWKPRNDVEAAVEYYANDFESGTLPERVSAYQAIETGDSKSEVVVDPRGINFIPTKLAEGIMDKIRLNTVVTNITYSSSGTGVTVLTKDGRRYTSDYIVVTVSAGVLASDLITFRPSLPDWKRQAIVFFPMGHYTKIFVKFSTKFWEDNNYIILASSKRGYYSSVQNMDRDGLFKGSRILVVTVTFPESERVEKLSMANLKKEIADFFATQYPSAMVKESSITDIFRTSWTNDPYVMGAYSAPAVGTGDSMFADLRAPYGSLWFAGEAIPPNNHYGNMQAALDSGRSQASSLINCMNNQQCPKYIQRASRACNECGRLDTKPSLLLSAFLMLFIAVKNGQ